MMHDLGQKIANSSTAKNEHNDCTVRALAVALDGDYERAHNALKARGRKNRRGAYDWQWKPAFEDCGLQLVDVTKEFTGRTIRTVTRELHRHHRGSKFVLSVRGHVAAYNGDDVIDWAKGRMHRIRRIYKVVDMNAHKPQPKKDEFDLPLDVAKPLFTEGNFISRVYIALGVMYEVYESQHNVPKRVNRKKICAMTGLAHGTVGHALDYLRKNNFNLKAAQEAYRNKNNASA